jgi:hypothetical protein
MTEVFKTSVNRRLDARTIRSRLLQHYPEFEVSFDLEDCDRILRVSAPRIVDADSVIDIVRSCGYQAEVLPDEVPSVEVPRPVCFR